MSSPSTPTAQPTSEFIPARDDPTVRRAIMLKNPDRSRWFNVLPHGGWDNAVDVEAGKRLCADSTGYVLRTNDDVHKIEELALKLRDLGISERTAVELLRTYNQVPFPKSRIELHVWIAYEERAVTPPGIRSQAAVIGESRWIAPDDDDAWMEGDGIPVWPRPMHYEKQRSNAELADEFWRRREECGGGQLMYAAGQFYSLTEQKTWHCLSDDQELAAEIRATDPQLVLPATRIFAMVAELKLVLASSALPFQWLDPLADAPSPENLILFRNGILDFETKRLISHTGQFFVTATPAYDYDADADCPLWRAKLREWLDESQIQTLQEFFGYALTNDASLHKILALIGVPRGGKSTVADVLQNLRGREATTSLLLESLGEHFGLEGTLDKSIIFVPDAAEASVTKRSLALNRLKTISGGDPVDVARKFLRPLSVKLPGRIVIVANKHPKLLDDSGALNKRELVITFRHSWAGNPALDPRLGEKLAAEMPGIANWALTGLQRLRANGGVFTVGQRAKADAADLERAQSPALRFAGDCLRVTGGKEFVDTDLLYRRYTAWCGDENLNAREVQNRTDFKAALIAALAARRVRHGQERPEGEWAKPRRGWWGVVLRHTYSDIDGTWT